MRVPKPVLSLSVTLLLAMQGGPGFARPLHESAPPWVVIASVNDINLAELPSGDPLIVSAIESVALVGDDDATSPDELVYLVQLVPVAAAGATLGDPVVSIGEPVITAFSGQSLPPGRYALRAQTRDADFNYSPMAAIEVQVSENPDVVTSSSLKDYPWAMIALAFLLGTVLGAAGMWAWRRTGRAPTVPADARAQEELTFERHFNPYISGEPVRRAEMFFARRELLNRMASGLHQNSIMVQGERRMGKTSLLIQLADLLRETDDPEWVFIPVMADLEGTPQELFFHHLMEATWGTVRGYLASPPNLYFHAVAASHYSDRDLSADLRTIITSLKLLTTPRAPRLVLLLDEVDVINGYDTLTQQQLRRILVSDLSENVGAVVAGSQISREWTRKESPWYNLFYEITLEPFTEEEARQLLTEPVRGVYAWDDEALDYLIALAEGRPHRLQQHGFAAVNHMLAAQRLHITVQDVEAARDAIMRTRAAESGEAGLA